MTLKLLASAALLSLTASLLTSCGGAGHVDVSNPTINQLDSLDVQWGLPKRTMRGGARKFDPVPSSSSYSAPAPAASRAAAAPAPAASSPAPAAPSAPATVDPNVIKSLR